MTRFGIITTVLLASTACAADKGEWVSIFNGRDLTGWKVNCLKKDRDKEFWKVVDGAIECDSIGRKKHDYVWLTTEKEYADFELKLKFQAFRTSKGNSGVQVRSRYDSDPSAPRGGWLDGPQVDIHPRGPWRNGLISDATREEKRWIHPSLKNWSIKRDQGVKNPKFKFSDEGDGWNEMVIICKGTKIKTVVNGVVACDFDGKGVLDNEAHKKHNVGMKGFIALQLHSGDELKIRFKDIQIREIKDK